MLPASALLHEGERRMGEWHPRRAPRAASVSKISPRTRSTAEEWSGTARIGSAPKSGAVFEPCDEKTSDIAYLVRAAKSGSIPLSSTLLGREAPLAMFGSSASLDCASLRPAWRDSPQLHS